MTSILDTIAYCFTGVVFLYAAVVFASCFWWRK